MAKKKTSTAVKPLTKTNQRKLAWIPIIVMIMLLLYAFAQPVADIVAPQIGYSASRVQSVIEAVSIAIVMVLVAVFMFVLFTGWIGLVAGLLLIAVGLFIIQKVLAKPKINMNGNN